MSSTARFLVMGGWFCLLVVIVRVQSDRTRADIANLSNHVNALEANMGERR